MKNFLDEIRIPGNISLSRKIANTSLLFIAGIILGVISKVLDETASNLLPFLLEVLDLGSFLSNMGIWIFLAILIAVYSKSPLRSAINVFMFFVGMVGSYYFYTVEIAGFYPKSYMMIWVIMTIISPFLAFVCWYAKGKGSVAIFISSILFLFISRQSFAFGFWYLDIINNLELLLWIATIFVLYQTPRQITKVLAVGIPLFFLTVQINLFWGML